MIDPEKTNDYFVRLTGKGNIPEPLEIGRNYEVKVQGTITSLTESDLDNGSHAIYYKFEPVIIEIVNDKGESIRAKDTRTKSQLFRSRVWSIWSRTAVDVDFDTFYNGLMDNLIVMAEEVTEMYAKSTHGEG